MTVLTVQNDFTHGEFDPKLLARFDIQQYGKAAEKLRNVVVMTQGGAKRRPGSVFIRESNSEGIEFKLAEFQFSDTEKYLLDFHNLRLQIYLEGVLVADIPTTITGAVVRDIKITQTTNLMIISHPSFAPLQLKRGATSALWTIEPFPIKIFPAHDFLNNYENQRFTLNNRSVGENRALTITGGPFEFTPNFVGGVFIGPGNDITEPLGFARIVGFVSATEVTVDITVAFSDDQFGGSGVIGTRVVVAEKAWSSTKGWPNASAFYQGRLWFGGSTSLPKTLFGSKIDDFISFDIGTGEASDAILEQLAGINTIKHLVASRTLQIFTSNSEFSPLQLESQPLTPSSMVASPQTDNGSTDVEPVVLDNQTFFIERGGRAVRNFVFANEQNGYTSDEISLFSPQLIRQPIDSAVLKGSARDDSDFLFLINEDGTLAAYQSREAQNISAWTLSETDGKFLGATQVGDDVFFMTERTISGIKKNYIERLNFDGLIDSSLVGTNPSPEATIGGLGHLEGKEVSIRGDGFVWAPQVVVGGEITIKDARGEPQPVTDFEIGLPFNTEIKPLPVVVQSSDGTTAYIPKRIVRIFIDYYESLGLNVQGVGIPFREFGPLVLDQAPIPQTEVEEFRNLGWGRRPPVEITQEAPLPMTILGIGYEVEI